jgi:hypothetical protein
VTQAWARAPILSRPPYGRGWGLGKPWLPIVSSIAAASPTIGRAAAVCAPNERLCGRLAPALPIFCDACGTAPRVSAFEEGLGDVDMAVDQTALRHIGRLMHQHFDAIVSEPLPPQLHELVERLKVEPEAAKCQAAKCQSAERPDRSPDAPILLPPLRTASA